MTEAEIDNSLRTLASATPRLAPSLLACTPASAVRVARSAARKLVQVRKASWGFVTCLSHAFLPSLFSGA